MCLFGRHMISIFLQVFLAPFVDFRSSLSLSLSNVYLRTFGGFVFTLLGGKIIHGMESPIGFADYLPFYYLRTFVRGKSFAFFLWSCFRKNTYRLSVQSLVSRYIPARMAFRLRSVSPVFPRDSFDFSSSWHPFRMHFPVIFLFLTPISQGK